MPNYTTNLNLEKPLQSEQYNIDVFNANADKIDQFAGQVPARALTADKLTTGAKINGVNFKGDTDVVTGAGFYYDTVTYGAGDLAFIYNSIGDLELHKSLQNLNIGHNPLTSTGYWEEVKLGGGSGLNLFDVVEKDHILTFKESNGFAQLGTYVYKTGVAGSRYGYPTFYNQCVKEMQAGTPTQTQLGDNTVTLYKNDNGHIFYDIADKDAIDAWYNTYGVAWYYGVDTANERIFLPRNDWFTQNGSTTEVGKFVKAGLPNITGDLNNYTGDNGASIIGKGATGAFYPITRNERWSNADHITNDKWGVGFDASRSNSIYGKSKTVQPNAVKKIFYMCVGNTDVESAITDIVDITTSENDTIPLGWSDYQRGVTPSSAFLASLGQQNSGTFYPTFYNEFSAKIGQAFGAGFIKAHTASDITDYDLVINQDEQTFRLPLKNGKENLVGDEYIQIGTLPANDATLTAPANGYYTISVWANATTSRFYMTNLSNNLTVGEGGANLSNVYWNYVMPCKKGDKIQFHYESIIIQDGNFYFCPNIGNGTLYYKVSNAVQNLQLLDVAETTTALANKQDKCIHIIDTYVNGTSGYRIWSDGYCEQWGRVNISGENANNTVNFVKTFKDTNYVVVEASFGHTDRKLTLVSLHTSNMVIQGWNNTSIWKACGYLASGQY